MRQPRVIAGFTLIELLVVIAVIAILAALVIPALAGTRNRGLMVQELAAGRTLMQGFMAYAEDHGEYVLAGYKNEPAYGPDGKPLSYPANARYPWRLYPYLGRTVHGSLLVNRASAKASGAEETYAVSLTPSLGMNVVYVGGDYTGVLAGGIKPTSSNYGKFCVTSLREVQRPSELIVFASARLNADGGDIPGYNIVTAPMLTGPKWDPRPFSPDRPAASYGYVDFRFNGRAVVACFDGHAEAVTEEALRDMRRWCNIADKPDWTLR